MELLKEHKTLEDTFFNSLIEELKEHKTLEDIFFNSLIEELKKDIKEISNQFKEENKPKPLTDIKQDLKLEIIKIILKLEQKLLTETFNRLLNEHKYITNKELEAFLILLKKKNVNSKIKTKNQDVIPKLKTKNQIHNFLEQQFKEDKKRTEKTIKYIKSGDKKLFIGGTYNKEKNNHFKERPIEQKGIIDKLLESNLLTETPLLKNKRMKIYTIHSFNKIKLFTEYKTSEDSIIKGRIKRLVITENLPDEKLIQLLKEHLYSEKSNLNIAEKELEKYPSNLSDFFKQTTKRINNLLTLMNMPDLELFSQIHNLNKINTADLNNENTIQELKDLSNSLNKINSINIILEREKGADINEKPKRTNSPK